VIDGKQPCLFLIQISVNPEVGAAICDYIAIRGQMNTCADLGDGGPEGYEMTDTGKRDRYLQEGLTRATHVLGLISPEEQEPWWLKRVADLGRASGIELALLTLKGVSCALAIYDSFEVLRGIRSLNEYLFRVSPEVDRIIFNNPEYGGLMAHTAPHHPLDAFLDWDM
jgi:hypothetical protein